MGHRNREVECTWMDKETCGRRSFSMGEPSYYNLQRVRVQGILSILQYGLLYVEEEIGFGNAEMRKENN